MSEDKTAYVRVVELEQEVIKLKELNREMVGTLKAVTYNYYDDYTLPYSIVLQVKKMLQKVKAEGEVGE